MEPEDTAWTHNCAPDVWRNVIEDAHVELPHDIKSRSNQTQRSREFLGEKEWMPSSTDSVVGLWVLLLLYGHWPGPVQPVITHDRLNHRSGRLVNEMSEDRY
ncbi:hypothetical protein MJO28_014746 [Puccinia striiformis f. sp. tritici]|uniref:Uncharacterized protein n=1 Tax=Puccinia striiformis f. sp. tritici TaxID=168172 RepID=A0ACC0DUT6_9BASI|nr:hypothetical protein MJO28_014746 [Puccinia striiformis f. sp. tritici]